MKARKLCLRLIRLHIKANLTYISGYDEFLESVDREFITEDIKHSTLLHAMKIGKKEGWLKAEWVGGFIPPYAGAASRSRCYFITETGKKEAFWWREKK